jgi:hypothetical protein
MRASLLRLGASVGDGAQRQGYGDAAAIGRRGMQVGGDIDPCQCIFDNGPPLCRVRLLFDHHFLDGSKPDWHFGYRANTDNSTPARAGLIK